MNIRINITLNKNRKAVVDIDDYIFITSDHLKELIESIFVKATAALYEES